MGWFSRDKENPIDAEAQKKDREAILNDAKFVESLDSHPNIDADSDVETLKQAHESFKEKEVVLKDLNSLLKKEISRDLGINFDAEENKGINEEIDKYLSAELIDNPERILQLKQEITEFNGFQAKIEAQNKVMEKLGTSMDALYEQSDAIQAVKDTKKWFQKIRSYSSDHKTAREEAESNHGVDLKDVKGQFKDVMEKLRTGHAADAEISQLKENFADLRRSILQDLAPMAAIRELAQEKAKEKLSAMMDQDKDANKSLKGIEKAKQLMDKIYGDSFHQETGIDYKGADLDAYEIYNKLNESLETTFKSDAEQAIDKVKGSSLTLKKMTEVLKPLFAQKQLGDKSAADTKEFLLNYLQDELMPQLPKSKQILLGVAIESLA